MISFSILCTNPRHGGQCELLIDANSAAEAELHVHNSRPHYIIKGVWPVEKKFICHGWCSRHDRYDALAYLTTSADEARAICERLHPDFIIDSIEQEV